MTRQDLRIVESSSYNTSVRACGFATRCSFIENFWLTFRWFLPPHRRDHGGSKVPDRIFFLFVWTATLHYRCSVRQARFHGVCRPSFYDMKCPRRFVRYPRRKKTKQKHVCTLDTCSLYCARYLFIYFCRQLPKSSSSKCPKFIWHKGLDPSWSPWTIYLLGVLHKPFSDDFNNKNDTFAVFMGHKDYKQGDKITRDHFQLARAEPVLLLLLLICL